MTEPQTHSLKPNVVLGVDIGGANLKLCNEAGLASSVHFPMWKQHRSLSGALESLIGEYASATSLVVTMTGELADCFVDRSEGVHEICKSVQAAAKKCSIDSVWFYGVDGKFRQNIVVEDHTNLLAASNWHALASFTGRHVCQNGLLVDIGSTTTDLIPIIDGQVATNAMTDCDRLSEGSLVYIGCGRTPVCGLCPTLPFREKQIPVMNEWFATIDDALLILGVVEEDVADSETADGKPRSKEFAANRLARMIGLDRRSVNSEDVMRLADTVRNTAESHIARAASQICQRFPTAATTMILSGHGGCLAPKLPNVLSLEDRLGIEASRCAPSYALTQLWMDHLQQPSVS